MSNVKYLSEQKQMLTVYNLPIPSFSNDQGWYQQDSTQSELIILNGESPEDLMPPPTYTLSSKGGATVQHKRAWRLENVTSDGSGNNLLIKDDIVLSINQKRREGKSKSGMTVYNKLVDIYLDHLIQNETKNENFIKCNYLEILVHREKLDHFILKFYPRGFALYVKTKNMGPVKVRSMDYTDYDSHFKQFFKAVDQEEIANVLFDLLCETPMLYDNHLIIQMQKFLSDIHEENTLPSEPVFSSFVLLKPTIPICSALTAKYKFQSIQESTGDDTQEEQYDVDAIRIYEAGLFSSICGDLYTARDYYVSELAEIFHIYANPFASESLRLLIVNAETEKPPLVQVCIEECKPHCKIVSQKCIPVDAYTESIEEFKEPHESSSFVCEDLQKVLHSILATMEIKPTEDPFHFLLEVFHFYVKKNIKVNNKTKSGIKEKKYKIAIYWKDGQFFICTGHKFVPDKVLPCLQYCVGNKERLDDFILTYAEIITNGFTQTMQIHHKGNKIFACNGRKFSCKSSQNASNHPDNLLSKKVMERFSAQSKNVIELTDSNFKEVLLNSGRPWLVLFYDSHWTHVQKYAAEWAEAATELKRKIKLGSINVVLHKVLADNYNIKELPTVKFFTKGDKDGTAEQYSAEVSAKGIIDWFYDNIAEPTFLSMMRQDLLKYVAELTDSNFEEKVLGSNNIWVVQFHAPWYDNYEDLTYEFSVAASKLGGRIKFGVFDVEAHTVIPKRCQIRDEDVPIIQIFPQKKEGYYAKEYKGEMKAENILKWLFDLVQLEIGEMEVLRTFFLMEESGKTFSKRQCRAPFENLPNSQNKALQLLRKNKFETDELFLSVVIKTIESKYVITMFEASPFELQKYKKSAAECLFAAYVKKKRNEIYPSLKSEFLPKLKSAKDFMVGLKDCDKVLTPKVLSMYKRLFPR